MFFLWYKPAKRHIQNDNQWGMALLTMSFNWQNNDWNKLEVEVTRSSFEFKGFELGNIKG